MADQALCEALYDILNVIRVDITMSSDDWSMLRNAEPHGGRCNDGFTGDRYEWFNVPEVAISGSAFPTGVANVFTQVGVKKRSYCGSFSKTKPALALNFSKFNGANEAVIEALIGTRFLTLNNSIQDQSFARQIVGFMAFKLAGLPYSRCNFAEVAVNGNRLGLYVNVEPPKKPYIEHIFGNTLGNLYELERGEDFNLSIAVSGRVSFEGFSPFSDGKDFALAAQAVTSGAPDSVVDLGQFKQHFALELLLKHWDGYAERQNNTYVYNDVAAVGNPSLADVNFKFLPWGLDQILQYSHDFELYDNGVLAELFLHDPRLRHRLDNQIIKTAENVFGLNSYNTHFRPLLDHLEQLLSANGEGGALDHLVSVRQQLLEISSTNWVSSLPGIALRGQSSKASPAAAVFSGVMHMVHLGEETNRLWHTQSADGDEWTTNVVIEGQKSKATPALAVFGERLHMVHLGDTSNAMWHSVYDGNAWSTNVMIPDQKSKATPALAVFEERLHMVHLGDTSNAMWHSVFDGKMWSTNSLIPGQKSKAGPALAVFGGLLHMVHLGDTSNAIWHSVFDGNRWSTNVIIPDQMSKAAPALAVFGGRLHMVHLGDTSNAMWHSVFDGNAWSPNVKARRKNSSLAPSLASFAQRLQVLFVDPGKSISQGWIARTQRLGPLPIVGAEFVNGTIVR